MRKSVRSLYNPSFMIFIKNENNLHFLLKYLLFNQIILPFKILYFFKNFFFLGCIFLLRKRLEPLLVITLFWNYFRYEFKYSSKFSFFSFTNKFKYNLIQTPKPQISLLKYCISKKEIEFRYLNYFIFNIKKFEMHYKIIFKEYFLEDMFLSRKYNFFNKMLYLHCAIFDIKNSAMQIQHFIKKIILWVLIKLINFIKKVIRKFLPLIGLGSLSENKYFLLIFILGPFLKLEFSNWNLLFRKIELNNFKIQRKSNLLFLELALKKKLLRHFNNFFFDTDPNNIFFRKGKNLEERRNKKFKKKLFFFKFLNFLKNLIIMTIIFFGRAFLFFVFFFLSCFFLLYFDFALDCSLISFEFKIEILFLLLDNFLEFLDFSIEFLEAFLEFFTFLLKYFFLFLIFILKYFFMFFRFIFKYFFIFLIFIFKNIF